jgi:hypothetical protein
MQRCVGELYTRAMQPEDIRQREEVLAGIYNKEENTRLLLRSIWP